MAGAIGAGNIMILSVSRRCDIPRFAFDWFLERLDLGFVEVSNPFNPGQKKRVSLLPGKACGDDVDLIVFWTRDASFILDHSDELECRGYSFYVMTTLNSYPALLEPNMPSTEAVVQMMRDEIWRKKSRRIVLCGVMIQFFCPI